jgi:hypothetical protein
MRPTRHRRLLLAVAACMVLALAVAACALTLLTGGKRAWFLDAPGSARDAARLYPKAGRARDAKTWYDAAVALGSGSGWKFTALARDRAASVDARVAAHRDADPENDPPIIGTGPGACSYCHAR